MKRRSDQLKTILTLLFCFVSLVWGLCPHKNCVCDDKKLTTICSSVDLDVIPIFLNPMTRRLGLAGNQIHALEDSLAVYTSLESLDLSKNKFKHVGRRQFAYQKNLQSLNLSGNYLTSLMDHSFQGPENLQILDLSHNVLSELKNDTFIGLKSLVELRLGHNLLRTIHEDAFRGLSRLRVVHLERNRLQTLSSSWLEPLQNLRFLYASENSISNLKDDTFKAVSALRVLELGHNKISENLSRFAFRGCRVVDTLDLSFNAIKRVPNEAISQLPQISNLDLSGNPLEILDADSLRNLHLLEILRVSNMTNLSRVDSAAFRDNLKLRELYLEHNLYLEPLPWGIFLKTSSIEILTFKGNTWSTLSPLQVPMHSLKQLQIQGLPLNCNCSIVWLWKLYKSNHSDLKLDEVYCDNIAAAAPSSARHQPSPLGGVSGDPLSKMMKEQLICPDISNLLLIISISTLVIVILFIIIVFIVYKCRNYKLKKYHRHNSYGGTPCLHFKDDTMVYKSALRTASPIDTKISVGPGGATLITMGGSSGGEYSPSEEPLYEVPKGDAPYSEPKSSISSSGGSSSKYSSAVGLVGNELWESDTMLCEAPSYYNPSLKRVTNQQQFHGSPRSTSTGVTSLAGSSSNSSSTGSNDAKPIFYSPSRFHNQMMLPVHQQSGVNSNFLLRSGSPPSPAPGGDSFSNNSHHQKSKTLMMKQYSRSPAKKPPPRPNGFQQQQQRALTGSLRGGKKVSSSVTAARYV